MKALKQKFMQFIRKEDGATAVEYAVMLALIIVVALLAITLLGKNVANTFGNVANSLPVVNSGG